MLDLGFLPDVEQILQLTRCWTGLQHTTASPRNITQIVRAALVLTNSGTNTSRELSEISDTRALLS